MKSKDPREAIRDFVATGSVASIPTGAAYDDFCEAARAQGLAGPVLECLVLAGLPEASLGRLRNEARLALIGGVQQLALASRVLQALASAGIEALPLKGAAVASDLYDSPADRPMADVDILTLGDFPASVRVLADLGFREIERAAHAWGFVDPETSIPLELHFAVTSCPRLFPIDGKGLWTRRRTGGVPRPCTEDLLLLLSMHAAFQHGLVMRLVQWLDFRRLFERETIRVDLLVEIVEASGAWAPLAAGLLAAERVVGAPVPRPLRELLEARLAKPLCRWLDRRLQNPLELLLPSAVPLARSRWELARGRRAALVRETLAPGGRDWNGLEVVSRAISLTSRWWMTP